MSGTETNQVIQPPLQPSQQTVVTPEGWRVEFNKVGEAPQIFHNGQAFTLTLADGVMVPAHVANDRPIDGAPAILWHRTNGRLTKNDIARTICDDKDNPIGIYTGVWAPKWAKGKEIRTYAAITDARDENGDRICKDFNGCVAYLNNHPNGEKLSDRPSHARHISYEMAMQARILVLKPGEFTGQMIMPLILLSGQEYPRDKVTHRNNIYDLRHTGDFANADNRGYDSRLVTENSIHPPYVSSMENRANRRVVYGTDFQDGLPVFVYKGDSHWSLRPFVAELLQP